MQDQIVPIDILERFENENDVSSAPSSDYLYVFRPNRDADNNISSYSAYGMTVQDLTRLYEEFCTWEQFRVLSKRLYELSSYYYNVIQPIMLSAFVRPNQLTGVYMCRTRRTENDFPYLSNHNSSENKQTPADISRDYDTQLAIRKKKMMYHGWADFQTKQTDISTLAWLAPGSSEPLKDDNAIAYDKYLEYRRQFIISLLQNRKRVVMARTNLYAQAIKVSRLIRIDKYDDKNKEEYRLKNSDLALGTETKLDEDPKRG